MKNIIKVRATDDVVTMLNNESRTIVSAVKEGEVFEAKLYRKTEEYFAKDTKGREFLVGHINIMNGLVLQEEFELAEVD